MGDNTLALDQSSTVTGFAVFSDGAYRSHGKIDLRRYRDADERIQEMERSVFRLIDRVRPDAVVIEETVLQRSPATLRMLARLQGAVMGYCLAEKIPCETVYPSVWRKALCMRQGNGVRRDELKRQAMEYVREKYGITASSDEADAVCIGLAYHILHSKEELS